MTTIDRYCPDCRDDRTFIHPFDGECAEGHGADCPEWACVDCGAAVLVGFADESRGTDDRVTVHASRVA